MPLKPGRTDPGTTPQTPGTSVCCSLTPMMQVEVPMTVDDITETDIRGEWLCVARFGSCGERRRGYSATPAPSLPSLLLKRDTRTLNVPKSTPATILNSYAPGPENIRNSISQN
jgi:hypothetical protein